MKIIAIDPGLKGGWALLEQEDTIRLIDCGRMPLWKTSLSLSGKVKPQVDVLALKKLFMSRAIYTAVTEFQTAMPGQSSVATATSFLNFGLVLSLRSLANLHVVHPAVWKRHFDLGPHKAAAIYHARMVYPDLPVTTPDGVAEAVLIGHYWIVAGAEKARLKAAKPRPQRRRKAKPRPAGRPSASSQRQGSGSSSGTGPA